MILRIEVRRGDADAGGVGGKPALGGADVGPPGEQCRAVADGNGLGDFEADARAAPAISGRSAGVRPVSVARPEECGLRARLPAPGCRQRAGRAAAVTRAVVELGREAGGMAALGQVDELVEQVDDVARRP